MEDEEDEGQSPDEEVLKKVFVPNKAWELGIQLLTQTIL